MYQFCNVPVVMWLLENIKVLGNHSPSLFTVHLRWWGNEHPQPTWRGDGAAVLVIRVLMFLAMVNWRRFGSILWAVENNQIRRLSKTNCVWPAFPPIQLKLGLHPIFGWLGSKQHFYLSLKVLGCLQHLMSITNSHAFHGLWGQRLGSAEVKDDFLFLI